MRRAGGWVLGAVAVIVMAGACSFVLRRLFQRETLVIAFGRGSNSRGPSCDAIMSGAFFALQENGGRAGGYRIQLLDVDMMDSAVPSIWLGTGQTLTGHDGDLQPLLVYVINPLPQNALGHIQILNSVEEQGSVAAGWAKESGKRRIAILYDQSSTRSRGISSVFGSTAAKAGLEQAGFFEVTAERGTLADRVLACKSDLVFFGGEEAPYGTTAVLFSELRDKGYSGALVTADADPEVSLLAVPSPLPAGTFLVSTIGPPSAGFASTYEPATGRHAGPHAWPGYLAMKAALDVIDRSPSGQSSDLRRTVQASPRIPEACALYVFKGGKFEFVQELK
jgi:hypothetical protein